MSKPSHAATDPQSWPLWPQQIEVHRRVLGSVAESTDARRQALIALLAYPEPVRGEALRTALAAQNSELHRDALRLCAELRSTSCREQARAYIETRPAPALALAALPAAIAGLDGEAQTFLFSLASDRDLTLRLAALRELNQLGHLECAAAGCLKQILPRLLDADAEVRRLSLQLLGIHGTPALSPAMSSLLRDPDPDVRLACIVALGRVADPRSVELLIRQLERASTAEMAEATLLALVQIPGPKVDALLIRLLHDEWVPEALTYAATLSIVGLRAQPGAELRAAIVGMIRRAGFNNPDEREQILGLLAVTAPYCQAELRALLDSGALDARSTAELGGIVAMNKLAAPRRQTDDVAIPLAGDQPLATSLPEAAQPARLARTLLSGQHPSALQSVLVDWAILHFERSRKRRAPSPTPSMSASSQQALKFYLSGWVQRRPLDVGLRCLALTAYVAWQAQLPDHLQRAIDGDPSLTLQVCRAQLWAHAGQFDRLGQALHDPRVPVRRAAVLGLWGLPHGDLRQRWAREALWDRDPGIRDQARALLKAKPTTAAGWRLREHDESARTWSFYDAEMGRPMTLAPRPARP